MNHLDIEARAQELGDDLVKYTAAKSAGSFPLNSAADVVAYVKESGIDSIYLWFTDLLGSLKSFAITPEELPGAFERGMGFDGSSIEGFQRIHESDMVARPIPTTARLVPFRVGPASAIRMFVNVHHARTDAAYEDDPRRILQRNLAGLSNADFEQMNIGPEAEFFLFRCDDAVEHTDKAGYFTLVPSDAGAAVRELITLGLKSMGVPVEYHHHEVAPSQHEIDLKYAPALEMADRLQTHKWLVKELARRSGIHATFMPKPIAGENGSGMHTHISLWRGGNNAFYNADGPYHLSLEAQSFVEGVLQKAPEMVLVTNPGFNSYRRLVPGFEAPVYIAWAGDNRSALIRIPENKGGNEQATRAEVRFPDPTANPYLLFSVLLRAGLEGIERKLPLRKEEKDDLYHLGAVERELRGIPSLPHDLYAAIHAGMKSDLLRKVLGPSVLEKLVATKIEENDRYRLVVTPLELQHGLDL